jgi:glycosyltransferase involved in cell wall biosynthesis
VLNEKNAVFFEAGNDKDLASKIKELIDNDAFKQKLAQEAKRSSPQYSWENRAKNILTFIKNENSFR